MPGSDLIQHVSDTARWIAAYRARETARPDAVFKDPLAERLAGPRGMEMVAATPYTESVGFAMVVRTTAIDRLVLSAIEKGVDTVINLGAGLDTRPYRMNLPAQLKWIELDFPHVLEYKSEIVKNERPVCKIQRIPIDLSLVEERLQLFSRLDAETDKALIITEGLIAYLTNAQAEQLSKDLYSMPHFQYWIQDYRQGPFRNSKRVREMRKIVKNAPFQFKVEYPLAFFSQHGWRVTENIPMLDEARRIRRRMPINFPWNLVGKLFRKKFRAMANNAYSFVMFGRS